MQLYIPAIVKNLTFQFLVMLLFLTIYLIPEIDAYIKAYIEGM